MTATSPTQTSCRGSWTKQVLSKQNPHSSCLLCFVFCLAKKRYPTPLFVRPSVRAVHPNSYLFLSLVFLSLPMSLCTPGFDGKALVHAAKTSKRLKQQLLENTNGAVDKGVIGVPSYRVHPPRDAEEGGGQPELVWGQDRLDVVRGLCAGWWPTGVPQPRRTASKFSKL